MTGADLLGPAPLLRLRGRYRAQLVAKTAHPRRLASQAARLLAAAAPNMRRAGLVRRRRRRSAEPVTRSGSLAAPWGHAAAARGHHRRVGIAT